MNRLDFIGALHNRTSRDYLGRVNADDKAECAGVARRWGRDYWDGERKYGYGGYHYDGRWRPVAEAIAAHYGLTSDQAVLDVGCGKGFLLYELTQVVPGLRVAGLDISSYAIEHAKPEIRDALKQGGAVRLPWADKSFDLVLSINTLHNLEIADLAAAVNEIVRVGRGPAWVCVESFRDEREKVNLLYWQLTCQSFYTPEGWEWLLGHFGYGGDVGYIFFT